MRLLALHLILLLSLASAACAQTRPIAAANHPQTSQRLNAAAAGYIGFDSNDYPGDAALPALRRHFAFVGYWLNNPPGEHQNGWVGKRETLIHNGFGFLVLANGRLESEIKKAKHSGTPPAGLGMKDAEAAV